MNINRFKIVSALCFFIVSSHVAQADVTLKYQDGRTIAYRDSIAVIAIDKHQGMIFNAKTNEHTYYNKLEGYFIQTNVTEQCNKVIRPLNDMAEKINRKFLEQSGLSEKEIEQQLDPEPITTVEIVSLGKGGKIAGYETTLVKIIEDEAVIELLWLSDDKQLVSAMKQVEAHFSVIDLNCGEIDNEEYQEAENYKELMNNSFPLKSISGSLASNFEDDPNAVLINIELSEDDTDMLEVINSVSFEPIPPKNFQLTKGLKQRAAATFNNLR